MAGSTLPAEAVELYALAPGEFVAARNALVKQLKRDRRPDDAAAVAALRRPSPADHAVNAAVRAEPDVATVWVDAVGALDDEQRAAIAGTANHLREAGAALREATARLVDAAVAAVDDERRRPAIIDALRAAATRPGAALVAVGILGAGDPSDDLFAGMPEPSSRPKPQQRPASEARPRPRLVAAPAAPAVDDERAARREAKAAAAAERLAAAEAAAAAADAALDAARRAEADARAVLHAATAELRHAQSAATRAAAELAAARRAVDGAERAG
ncbi:MAG: hypothetical protein QM733_02910 [Ilumatobacteraceae bacterium]